MMWISREYKEHIESQLVSQKECIDKLRIQVSELRRDLHQEKPKMIYYDTRTGLIPQWHFSAKSIEIEQVINMLLEHAGLEIKSTEAKCSLAKKELYSEQINKPNKGASK